MEMFVFSSAKPLCSVNYIRLCWRTVGPRNSVPFLWDQEGCLVLSGGDEDACVTCSRFSGSVRPIHENGCCLCWNWTCCLAEMEALFLPSHSAIAFREVYRPWAHTMDSIAGEDKQMMICMQYFGTSLLSCWLADAEILGRVCSVYRDGLLCHLRFWPVLSFRVVSARELLD